MTDTTEKSQEKPTIAQEVEAFIARTEAMILRAQQRERRAGYGHSDSGGVERAIKTHGAANLLADPALRGTIHDRYIAERRKSFYVSKNDDAVREAVEAVEKSRGAAVDYRVCNYIGMHLSATDFKRMQESLQDSIEARQKSLKAVPDLAWWQKLTGIGRKDREANIARLNADISGLQETGEAVQKLQEVFVGHREGKIAEALAEMTPQTLRILRFSAVHDRLETARAMAKIVSKADLDCNSSWVSNALNPQKKDYPALLTPNGDLHWSKMRDEFAADSELFEKSLWRQRREASDRLVAEKQDADFRAVWGMSREERDTLFLDAVPGVKGEMVREGHGGPTGSMEMSLKYPGLLRARIYWFPEEKSLGIESIYVPENARGVAFKPFMNALVDYGEAIGAQKLRLLAGEESGAQVWSRLGAHAEDETIVTYEGGGLFHQGRPKDYYLSWERVVDEMRQSIIPRDSWRYKADNITDMAAVQAILGQEGDPLPPKDSLQELQRLGVEIPKFAAMWDFTDPKQLATLRAAIAVPQADEPSLEAKAGAFKPGAPQS